MKKLIPFVLLSITLFPLLAIAQGGVAEPPISFPTNTTLNIWEMLKKAAKWLLNIVVLVGVIIIVWAGFTYVTAAGDSDKTKKALNAIIYALLGIAIALLAYWLVNVVLNFIGIPTTVSP